MLQFTINVLFTILLFISYLESDINILLVSLFILFVSCVIYACKKIEERIVYLLFLVCFFTFLMGKYLYQFLEGNQWWEPFSKDIVSNTVFFLIISLISITLGNLFAARLNSKKSKEINVVESIPDVYLQKKIRKISLMIFYITLIPSFYTLIDRIVFTQTYGYLNMYLNYTGVPIIIERMSTINMVSLYMFLSTMPKKRETTMPIMIYLVYNVLTLFTGQRADAVIAFLIIFFYSFFRASNDKKWSDSSEVWFSKGRLVALVTVSPLAIAFLTFWSYFRKEGSNTNFSFSDLFFKFFDQQGFSVNIISYAQLYEFPDTNISYTFGPLIKFFRNNVISQSLFDIDVLRQQTVEMALYGNTFSETISFLVIPEVYLSGGGIGNSYISELYVDFGLIGIVIFNFILGLILHYINQYSGKKPWLFTGYLLMLNSIFMMPRSSALGFVTLFFNMTTLITIIGIYFLARIKFKN